MIRDANSREIILSDFRTTLFVEAGAGSGKTTMMVSRIMMILLQGLADIRRIVAITFTNEGAASLRSRILQELERAAVEKAYAPLGGETLHMLSAEELGRIYTALEHLPLAHFSTIHSFCLALLKERPVEAGIDPLFDMNTEGSLPDPFPAALLKFLLGCARSDHPFIRFMLDHDLKADDVAEVVRIRSQYPDLLIHMEQVEPLSGKDIHKAYATVSGLVAEMHDNICLLENERHSKEKERRLQFLHDILSSSQACSAEGEKLAFLLQSTKFPRWNQSLSFFATRCARIEEVCDTIRKGRDNFLHARVALFAEEFLSWYSSYKKRSSSLYFDDLLFLTREMLRTNPDVREYFKRRFSHLFIDETQDTDPLQTEVVFFLSEQEGEHAGHWRDVALTPSKLFMVGDPKQSIYRFRRADITMYEEAKECIVRQGGKILTLEKNFRSGEGLIHFINDHFKESFARYQEAQRRKLHPAYTSLAVGVRGPATLPKHVIALTGHGEKGEYLRDEAARIILLIRSLVSEEGPAIRDPATGLERPILFGDIMMLMRAMTDVEVYERMFEEEGIPHYQVGGKTFFASEDLRGLVFALQAIDDVTDTVSLFGALRSPVFGFSDQMLFDHVVASGRPLSYVDRTATADTVVAQALVLLRDLHYRRERLGASGVVKMLFDAMGICHAAVMEQNGIQKAARYFRFLELIHEVELDQRRSFRGVVDHVRSIMAMDDPQLANVNIAKEGKENAVRIMTIHRAKGLESPVVILANGNRQPFRSPPRFFVQRGEGKVVIPYETGGYYALDAADLKSTEALCEDCESERLRYVAATRARDLLVLCVPNEKQEKTFNGMFAASLKINSLVGMPDTYAGISPGQGKKKPANVQKEYERGKKARGALLEQRSSIVEKMKTPFSSVHDLMMMDDDVFRMRRVSHGKAFGVVLHRLMQFHVDLDEFDADTVVDEWMAEEGVPLRHRNDLLSAFGRLRQHPLVAAGRAAAERFTEWEFFVSRGDRIVNGVIDLVYRDPDDSWVVVDYKTDDVTDPERRARLNAMYEEQLSHYARAFEDVTKKKVRRRVILYAFDEVPVS